jgi:hypothetical protein
MSAKRRRSLITCFPAVTSTNPLGARCTSAADHPLELHFASQTATPVPVQKLPLCQAADHRCPQPRRTSRWAVLTRLLRKILLSRLNIAICMTDGRPMHSRKPSAGLYGFRVRTWASQHMEPLTFLAVVHYETDLLPTRGNPPHNI